MDTMSLITAWHPIRSSNRDHACLDSLISLIHLPEEIDRMFDHWDLQEGRGAELGPQKVDELMDLMLKHDIDRIPRGNTEYSIRDGKIRISDLFEDENGDERFTETSPIHEWIDERIGTQVTILNENGERTCLWEELNPELEFAHKFGPKSCKCK